MAEIIGEPVSVDFLSNHVRKTAYPWIVKWRGRQYKITSVGLHTTQTDGRTLIHIYSVTDGSSWMKLQFNTETLGWQLLEIESVN